MKSIACNASCKDMMKITNKRGQCRAIKGNEVCETVTVIQRQFICASLAKPQLDAGIVHMQQVLQFL